MSRYSRRFHLRKLYRRTRLRKYNGEAATETFSSAQFDLPGNQMKLVSSVTATQNNCASSDPTTAYEHTELKQVWKSPCVAKEETWLAFYKNSYVKQKYVYSDAGCNTKRMYIEWNGPYTIKTDQGTHKDINISIQNYYVKVFETSLKNDFNTSTICGIGTWVTNSDIDVQGKNCDFNSLAVTTSENFSNTFTNVYDIYKITGTNLTIGDTGTGDRSSEAQRPSSLDATNYAKDISINIIPTWAIILGNSNGQFMGPIGSGSGLLIK